MIKLIASDLDGTLLQDGAQVLNPEIFPIIRELKKKGIHFVAASGRQYSNLRNLFHEVQDDIFYVAENGGLYDLGGEPQVPSPISPDLIKEIILTIRKDPDCELTISSKETTFIEPKNKLFLDHLKNVVQYDITVVDDLLEIDVPSMKMAICNPKGIEYSESKYRDIFSDKITVVTSGNMWLDFMPHGVNKGVALQKVIDSLGILPKECMAFGDQWNDEHMLKLVGTSYAMSNAVPGISDFCTHTTDSVEKELLKLL